MKLVVNLLKCPSLNKLTDLFPVVSVDFLLLDNDLLFFLIEGIL